MSEREFVVMEKFESYDDDQLVDVQVRLEDEAARVIAELKAENQRRADAAIERAKARAERSGVAVNVAAPKGPRGPKPKTPEEKAADKAAKAAKREAVEMAEPLEFSGRA